MKFPQTIRVPVDTFGRAQAWLWKDSGLRLGNLKLKIGIHYKAKEFPLPKDGGDFPAGTWCEAKPSGNVSAIWD